MARFHCFRKGVLEYIGNSMQPRSLDAIRKLGARARAGSGRRQENDRAAATTKHTICKYPMANYYSPSPKYRHRLQLHPTSTIVVFVVGALPPRWAALFYSNSDDQIFRGSWVGRRVKGCFLPAHEAARAQKTAASRLPPPTKVKSIFNGAILVDDEKLCTGTSGVPQRV